MTRTNSSMRWPAERFAQDSPSPLYRSLELLELVHGMGKITPRYPLSWYRQSFVMPATMLDSRVTTNEVIRELKEEEKKHDAENS